MIPAFDIHGVVPPTRPGVAGHSNDRAPYPTSMLMFCQRFGHTPERRVILRGLIELRAALLKVGITEGYQWLDGSFVEDVERLHNRPPGDIDVVTFAALGDAAAQRSKHLASPALFDSTRCKAKYHVDHYFLGTDRGVDESLGRRISYWYSMWAHQRDTNRWKGFVSVSLASNDSEALTWLDGQNASPGGAR